MSVKTIEREQELCKKMVLDDGMIPNEVNKDFERELRRAYDEVRPIFNDQIVECGLRYLFIFDPSEQRVNEFRTIDGRTIVGTDAKTGKGLAAIGVATAAIMQGHDYTVLVLLHELCHAFTRDGEHPADWHGILDKMLAMYNAATGRNIKNDYDQIEYAHRSRLPQLVAVHPLQHS